MNLLMRACAAFGVIALAVAALFGACGGGGDREATPAFRIPVFTSLELFADFVREIGREQVEVRSLGRSLDELHSMKPGDEDITFLSRASVVLLNSRDMEPETMELVNQHRRGSAQVIRFALNVPSPSRARPGQFEPTAEEVGDNLYLWMDPEIAGIYADSVADSLAIVDGPNTDLYWRRSTEYRMQIMEVADSLAKDIERIPLERRKIVTLRDSFPYFARYFGLEIVGVVQAEGREPTAEEVDRLAELIRAEGVRAIVHEPGADSAAVEQLVKLTDARPCPLYTDGLDDRVRSYLEMLRFNVKQIVSCLK